MNMIAWIGLAVLVSIVLVCGVVCVLMRSAEEVSE